MVTSRPIITPWRGGIGISDNYYVESDVSVDGHHWLVGNYPNEVLETAVPAAYGGHFSFQADADAPGRLSIGSTHPFPETYPRSRIVVGASRRAATSAFATMVRDWKLPDMTKELAISPREFARR